MLVEAGDVIPADGEVIEGVASVDESAITGESAPVIRESGGDFSSVTGGTRVLSDWIVVRVTVNPGETFLDRMIAMVEGAKRQKTPNEIALTILLVALTLVFLLVMRHAAAVLAVQRRGRPRPAAPITITVLVALLVCLIPTTIGGLLSAIGVAGMSRMMQANVIATSGRAVEAAGDVDVLLLDKTGTITLGNRQASRLPAGAGRDASASWPTRRSSPRSPTRRPKAAASSCWPSRSSTCASATSQALGAQLRAVLRADAHERRRPRTAARSARARPTRSASMSRRWAAASRRRCRRMVDDVARRGSTPLVVADGAKVLGVIELKDIVKGGIKERFAELRRMGIKTVMITGDNRLTAAAIAAEAGVDDFLAEATPEAKLKLIREHQAEGRLVAMTGDGTNDAPALAQADVAVAMNTGTQAAKEAGNMVDLDSQPDQADRDRRDRQADADDARLADHLQHRQRRRQVLRHHPGGVRRPPTRSSARSTSCTWRRPNSAILSAVIFNALIIVVADPAGAEGRALPRRRRGRAAAPQPADLRPRRPDRAVHRHQADRPAAVARRAGLKREAHAHEDTDSSRRDAVRRC